MESRVGEGSIFTGYLPVAVDDHTGEEEMAAELSAICEPGGSERWCARRRHWHTVLRILCVTEQRKVGGEAAMARILMVEDNEMNRDALSRRLARRGFEVMLAVDGKQGLAMAQSVKPDLILMDLSLPEVDGWEATRCLKADAATAHIPLIILSSHAMTGDREKALAAGGDDFDTKPVDFPRLLAKITALLQEGMPA